MRMPHLSKDSLEKKKIINCGTSLLIKQTANCSSIEFGSIFEVMFACAKLQGGDDDGS